MLIDLFYIALISLLACQLLVPVVARLAIETGGGLDLPDQRKVHRREVPRLGGIAIFLGFLTPVLFWVEQGGSLLRGILLGALILFVTGLVDDIVGLTPLQKLSGEALGALVVILIGGVQLTSLGNPLGIGGIELGSWSVPVTLFMMVGVVNAVNMLDGLDGLAAGVCLLAALCFAVLAFRIDHVFLMYLAMALSGSLVGFLVYNTYPARIFMGDSGSLLLGYLLAVFSIMLVESDHGQVATTVPLLVLLVPILDTLVVMFGRWRCGTKIFSADRSHLHHRLMDLGIGHRQSVLLVYGISYLCGLAGVLFYQQPDYLLMAGMVLAAAVVYLFLCRFRDRSPKARYYASIVNRRDLYRSIVQHSTWLLLAIKYLLLLLLFGTVAARGAGPWLQGVSWLLLASLVACIGLKRAWRDRLLLVLLYLVAAVLVFRQVNYSQDAWLLGGRYHLVANSGYLLLAVAVLVKGAMRKRFGRLVDRPFEYLLLLVALTVPLLPHELTGQWHLTAVVAKCLVLFAALKLVVIRKTVNNRKILFAMAVALLFTW